MKHGHSSAGVLSIGVCEVPIPKTILAMTVCSRAARLLRPLRDGTGAPRARQLWQARNSPTFGIIEDQKIAMSIGHLLVRNRGYRLSGCGWPAADGVIAI